MYVLKRDGKQEPVQFDKITERISNLCYDLDTKAIDPIVVAKKVIDGLYPGVSTTTLDELASDTCAALISSHPDFGVLAARIFASNLQKNTEQKFSTVAKMLHSYVEPKTREPAPLLSDEVYAFIEANAELLDRNLVYKRDLETFDIFGLRVLARSYLLKINDKVVERPQHMWMRVACGLNVGDVEQALETYHILSLGFAIFGSPTLFNCGLPIAQLSSCFLQTMKEDSIDGIFATLASSARISKGAGGQSVACHKIRATGSYIRSTNGHSNGLVPMLRVFQSASKYVDQGGGKRKGSLAPYLEPWHADIEAFLDLRKNTGNEDLRCRDLFTALWVPDLFMERVEGDGLWSLFCPNEARGLHEVWGEEFNKLYRSYEVKPGLARKCMRARDLWDQILDSIKETGTPYMLMKDTCNAKSNHKHMGCISSSNLCAEIVQYTSPTETAVCNLASLALPKFVVDNYFDYEKLYQVTKIMVRNLNKVIDRGWLPTEEAKYSQSRCRAIGLGVQGLQDAFILLRLPFESSEARAVNINIFETMYFAACEASCELAIEHGKPYETFPGSPMSKGMFQFDLWGVAPSKRYPWNELRAKVMKHGMANSLLIALMPTCSTSQILGNNESFEPSTYLMFTRRALSGEFVVVSKYLMRDLMKLELWSPEMKNRIIANEGSIQGPGFEDIPAKIRDLYKTVWEIKQRCVVDMAVDRGPFVCQSQSMNIYMQDPTNQKITAMLFHGWKRGLKTCMYYFRTRAASNPTPVTVDPELEERQKRNKLETQTPASQCSLKNKDCVACGG